MNYMEACDEMIGKPNPFVMDIGEASALRFASIRGSFEHHYANNEVYRNFCDDFGVNPDDIKTPEDIPKIALITSEFFKQISAYKEEDQTCGTYELWKRRPIGRAQGQCFSEV